MEKYEVDASDRDAYVPPERFGRDHWSVLLYLDVVDVDHAGGIDNRKMRCNGRLHRPFAHAGSFYSQKEYPTRLSDGVAHDHDDWSCLEDFVACGWAEAWFDVMPGSGIGGGSAVVHLTEAGRRTVSRLRGLRAQGRSLSRIQYAELVEDASDE